MPKQLPVSVKKIKLDLDNPRTVHKNSELEEITSLIRISPDWFYELMESLIDRGYLPTENLIIQEELNGNYTVKEGNRRLACLKIALGYVTGIDLPSKLNCGASGTMDSHKQKGSMRNL
jgi:hypothetical protein